MARQVARALTQLYDSRLRGAGIEAPQYALMMRLKKQGPSSQVALGRTYALDKTTVSRNVKVLERNGWIVFSETDDRRERQVALTAEGEQQLRLARTEWKNAQEGLRSTMTAVQWEAMFEAFKTVTSAALELRRSDRLQKEKRK